MRHFFRCSKPPGDIILFVLKALIQIAVISERSFVRLLHPDRSVS
jgi:hypothetical protein